MARDASTSGPVVGWLRAEELSVEVGDEGEPEFAGVDVGAALLAGLRAGFQGR